MQIIIKIKTEEAPPSAKASEPSQTARRLATITPLRSGLRLIPRRKAA